MNSGVQIVGAAARYTTRTISARPKNQGWQEHAWDLHDCVPEVRFAGTWVGNAMSAARLYAGRRADDGSVEEAPDDHPAAELVASIAGGPAGQSRFLGAFGPHLVVPGEGWIVIQPTQTAFGTDWRVLSTSEVTSRATGMVVEIDGQKIEIPPHDPDAPADPTVPVVIRVWQPHPRRYLEADSPVRSSLSLLDELQALNAAVKAIARSRITGRGVLLVPQGARFPTRPGEAGDADDDLLEVFMQVAETSIKQPESAAATVPIILEVPSETIDKIQHITFESDFDRLALELREELIRRFAMGLELPVEVLLGMSSANHWTSWGITEEAIRLGVEPRLGIVADALTTEWLRPLLEDRVLDAEEWLVWYDTAALRVRSNRAQTAIELYDRHVISDEALRRETGFDDDDAPVRRPDNENDEEEPPDEDDDRRSQVPPPNLPVDENPGPPDTLPAAAAAYESVPEPFVVAADGIIWAAMRGAGEKLLKHPVCPRSRRGEYVAVSPVERHTKVAIDREQVDQYKLLDSGDVWERVGEIAGRYSADPACLERALRDYCRDLITAGLAHDYGYVAPLVEPCLVPRLA